MDRATTRTDPLGHGETFAYDAAGNMSQHTDRKGQVAAFTHDALNRLTGATYTDATVTDALDGANRLTQLTESDAGTIARSYDGLDRLTSETTGLGTVAYTYDALGRRTQMTVWSCPSLVDTVVKLPAVAAGRRVRRPGD
jgi:YD repeat-containing protein